MALDNYGCSFGLFANRLSSTRVKVSPMKIIIEPEPEAERDIRKPGRPRSDNALTSAEKSRRYRASLHPEVRARDKERDKLRAREARRKAKDHEAG